MDNEIKEEVKTENKVVKFLRSKLFKNLLIFVIVFSSTFIGFNLTIESTFVDGSSMYPTLKHKDFALTYKLGFKIGSIKRFDIITFSYNDDTYVKRVIALPNETITYTDGVLYINDKVVEEKFISDSYKIETAKKKGGSFTKTLGKGEYFVMGDNRKVSCGRKGDDYCSYDSRSFGTIMYEDIKSRGITVIGRWPKTIR